MFLEKTVERVNLSRRDTKRIRSFISPNRAPTANDEATDPPIEDLLLEVLQVSDEEMQLLVASRQRKKKTDKKHKEKETDDISTVAEDSDDIEDVTDDGEKDVKDIVDDAIISYDKNAERAFMQEYGRLLKAYADFLSEQLKGGKYKVIRQSFYTNYEKEEKEEVVTTDVQMLTYREQQEHVRNIVINSMMGGVSFNNNGCSGGSGSNSVDPNTSNSWYHWRVFQHNQILSFLYTSKWRSA